MPKVSFHPGDAYTGGFMVPEGLVEVTDAKAIIHQFPPSRTTGEQQDPATYAVVEFQALTKSGDPDGEVVAQYYKFGATEYVLPTNESGDGSVDDEVGEEGGSFWAAEDGWKPNSKTQWMVFTSSLIKAGFNEDRIRSGEMAELIGTVGEVKHLQQEGNIGGKKTEWTVPIMKNISTYPYDSKGKARAKPATAKTAGDTEVSAEVADFGVDEIATEVLMAVISRLDKKSVPLTAVRRDMMGQAMTRDGLKTPDVRKVVKKLDDKEFMIAAAEEMGFEIKGKNLVLS